MDPLRDRQSDAIWNAIEANNFKQALKLVDKKLAKKHDDYLEALRIYIRAKSPQISEKSDVLTHLEELAGRKPSVLDPAVIELYNHTVTWVLPTSSEKWAQIVGELWWQCVKASPKDENNSRNAFKACLGKDDLDHARQIANSLEKAFPANVSYAYWNITLMFMYSLSESCSESSQKLWGGLALAQITKLANATKGAANSKKPPARGIRSPQELELLHRILQENGKSDLRLEYLMDPNLGPRSAAAKGAWQMWRFELKLLEDAQKWNELFVVTLTLLKLARTRNKQGQLAEPGFGDWIVWEACIRSAIELGEATWISKIREEVEAHLDPKSGIDKSWRRNASLAWVKLHFDNDEVPAETRSTLLLKYLEESGDATTAYNDLAPYVAKLPLEQRSQVNKGLKTFPPFSTANDITRAVNKLKLAYLLTSSLPEYERQQSPLKPDDLCNECSQSCGASCSVTLKPLAAKIINGYKQALADDGSITKNLLSTDRHPADDIAVLGAMCLVKLSLNYFPQASDPLQRPAISYILQATALLESAYTHSKSNFQINLMLIRLYSYLGCGSLAMRAYQRLGVKGIQQDTLSYTILERISTLHPHPFSHSLEGMGEVKSPEEDVKHQGEYYNIAQDQCAKNIWLSFKHDSFNSILDIRGVKERLELSMGACRCVIESRKLSRLLHPEADIDAVPAIYEDLPISSTPHLSNNNDHLTFPNFEAPLGSRFEALSRFEPVPSQTRYRYALLGECILFLSSCPHPSEPELSLARQWLSAYASVAKFPSPSDEMTEAENLAAKVNHVLAMLLFQITSPPSRWAEEGYEKCLKAYNAIVIVKLGEFRELVEKKGTTAPAFQECLHILYTAHSVACTVMSFIVWMSTLQRGAFKEYFRMTTSIAESAMGLAAFVVETSTKIKKSLDEGGWIDRVLESLRMEGEGREEVSKLVEEVVGEDGVEAWAGDVLESWRESVVGLGLMKVLGSK